MSELTLDTAIKHCLDVAEQNETQAEKWYKEGGAEWGKTINCRECAADHRQLAEWLRELKDLREEYAYISKVSYGYYKELKEAKRLLKAAVDDFNSIGRVLEGNDILCMKYIVCKGCPFDGDNCNKWRYADEAEKLLNDEK